MNDQTRRAFLTGPALSSAALAAAKTLKPSLAARSAARVLGANDRINVGMIGVGGMGGAHLRAHVKQSETTKDIQVVAVSDIYAKRKEKARTAAKLALKDVHHDYRELLARDDVDAVFVATPDHWHAQIALDALAAGKDVYLQKPMTYTIEEARAVRDAAARYNRILQVGSQGLSDPRHHKARELIAEGEIGELLWAQTTASRNSILGEWNYHVDDDATPENLDWNRWLGTAPKRSFSPERYFRWRKYWDYSGGIATDLFYHSLGPLVFAMGAGLPTRVTACGGIYVQKDREVPDTYATQIEYPGFYITISGSMANAAGNQYHGIAFYGHKGTLTFQGDKVVVTPEALAGPGRKEASKPAKTWEVPGLADVHRPHTDNFFACMRSRKPANLNPDLGYRIMVAIRLGVDAYREGRAKLFDPGADRAAAKAAKRPEYEGDGKNRTA
jgi:predicted dehydrogenase